MRYLIACASLLGLLLINPLDLSAQGDIDPNDPGDRAAVIAQANGGDSNAQLLLGFWYLNGDGVDRDLSEAFDWMQRAAYGGNATAQYTLADMYRQGEGAPYDESKAIDWMEKAAAQGHAQAIVDLMELRDPHDDGGQRVHGDWMSRIPPQVASVARTRTGLGDPALVMSCIESGLCYYSFLLFRECEHDRQVPVRVQAAGVSRSFSLQCINRGGGGYRVLLADPGQTKRFDPLVRKGRSLRLSFPGGQGEPVVFSLKGSAAAIDRARRLAAMR